MSLTQFFTDPSQWLLLIAALGGLIVALMTRPEDKRRKCLGVLLAVSGVALYLGTVKASYSQAKDQAELLRLTKENADINARLVEASKAHAELLTGGRMYCTFFPFNRTNEVFDLELGMSGSHSSGSCPVLRDVTVYITRSAKTDALSAIDTPYRARKWTRGSGDVSIDELSLGTLHSEHRGVIYGKLDLHGISFETCLVEFFSLNGSWVQMLQFEKVNGSWTYAVTTMPCISTMSFIIAQQQVHGAFPTNKLAKISRIWPNG